jgi:hypothetical protein
MTVLHFPSSRPARSVRLVSEPQLVSHHTAQQDLFSQNEDLSVAESLSISCSTCVMAGSAACDDCIVTFLCDPQSARADRRVELDVAEANTIDIFSRVGLAPQLRHAAASN